MDLHLKNFILFKSGKALATDLQQKCRPSFLNLPAVSAQADRHELPDKTVSGL
jgi:hypothetical protein